MASWKGHMGGATVFFVAPAAAAVTLGGGSLLLDPPVGLAELGSETFLSGAAPEEQAQALRVGWSALLFSAAIFGGLLPDVDTASVGRRFTWTLLAGLLVATTQLTQIGVGAELWIFNAVAVGLVAAATTARHRGWTHSLEAAFAMPLVLVALPLTYFAGLRCGLLFGAAVTLGHLSHLWMDAMLARECRRVASWPPWERSARWPQAAGAASVGCLE